MPYKTPITRTGRQNAADSRVKVSNRLLEYRPAYHLQPPAHHANDLSGIFWRGRYHVFYGYDPTFPIMGPKAWGHAVSRDLIHWRHLPPMLPPDPGGYDKDGAWTGCVILDDAGRPRAFYTGVHPQAQCLAGSADMLTWRKFPGNPVIRRRPGPDVTTFRDPCVWREADGWYMALGGGFAGKGGAVLLYRSHDLKKWKYLHPLFTPAAGLYPAGEQGVDMYECPDFFPLADRYVLLVSTQLNGAGRTLYFTGQYRNHRFVPEAAGVVCEGAYYAAKTILDDHGRRILIGWIPDDAPLDILKIAGWSGAYSLPVELSLRADGHMNLTPAPELTGLRQCVMQRTAKTRIGDGMRIVRRVAGACFEIECEWRPESADESGILLFRTPDAAPPAVAHAGEVTRLYVDRAGRRLVLDRRQSTLFGTFPKTAITAPLRDAGHVALRVFVDRSIIEVFANGRLALIGRAYPLRPASRQLALYARGGAVDFTRLCVHRLGLREG